MQFKRKPCNNIILGDSRMNRINISGIKEITNEDYYNFSYGGATIEEICKTFWVVAESVHLENVYIGLHLNLYNTNNSRDRVSGAILTIRNPMLYLINRDVIKASFLLLRVI